MVKFSLSGITRAAENMAKSIDLHLCNINTQLQGFLTKAKVDNVLEDTKETLLKVLPFLDTSMMVVKILPKIVAIVLLIIAMFFCRKTTCLLSSNSVVNWLMKIMVELVMLSCLAMILFLSYQLVMIEFLGYKQGVHDTGIWNGVCNGLGI